MKGIIWVRVSETRLTISSRLQANSNYQVPFSSIRRLAQKKFLRNIADVAPLPLFWLSSFLQSYFPCDHYKLDCSKMETRNVIMCYVKLGIEYWRIVAYQHVTVVCVWNLDVPMLPRLLPRAHSSLRSLVNSVKFTISRWVVGDEKWKKNTTGRTEVKAEKNNGSVRQLSVRWFSRSASSPPRARS